MCIYIALLHDGSNDEKTQRYTHTLFETNLRGRRKNKVGKDESEIMKTFIIAKPDGAKVNFPLLQVSKIRVNGGKSSWYSIAF
jgi:hypothetical protein